MTVTEKLMRVQTQIKAPKNLYNSFGKYKYRNAEGICEAVKPYLAKEKLALALSDYVEEIGGRVYIKAVARLIDVETNESIEVRAYAREEAEKKGMDASQITGSTSSYARKYALNGLFLLDDTKDADTDEYKVQAEAQAEAQEDKQRTEEIGRMKIAPVKVDVLKKRCADDGVSEEKVLNLYKIKKFEDMSENQFRNAFDNWDKIKGM